MEHKAMDVKTMVKLFIRQQGMAGLCNDDGCGCSLDDFAPCGEGPFPYCRMARRLTIPGHGDLIHPITNEKILITDGKPGDDIFVDA